MNPPAPRLLPPLKTVRHAFRMVMNYRGIGLRISLVWNAILAAIGIADIMLHPPTEQDLLAPTLSATQMASVLLGLLAFSSIAVNWHRFILLDEQPKPATGLRLDGLVWRYAGNALAISFAMAIPIIILLVVTDALPPPASLLLLPAMVLAGMFALVLAIKLPAAAIGNTSFGFRDALAAAHDNFWPLFAILFLNIAVALSGLLVLVLASSLFQSLHPAADFAVSLVLGLAFNIFFTLFSISVSTSIYGFLVEKRDF